MSIEYIIKGVKVNISEEDYARIMTAEDEERRMQIQKKYDRARDELKAPEGMFAVCVWDPSNPEKSIPIIAETQTTGRDAIYKSEKYAAWYARKRNKQVKQEYAKMNPRNRVCIGETEYFVMNDRGQELIRNHNIYI